jgi:DNA-binding HxlR family transcriptional regulator
MRNLARVSEDKCRHAKAILKKVAGGALDVLTRPWTGEILLAGDHGARRFSEYRRAVIGVSDRMLTVRLRQLEALGLMSRTVESSSRVKVMYTPTEHAVDLLSVIRSFLAWGEQDVAGAGAWGAPAPPWGKVSRPTPAPAGSPARRPR